MGAPEGALRLRVQFSKQGQARFLSHSEFSRTLMISARRAGLPLEYAGAKMARMKISLSPPLPIGITSDGELVDFNLTGYVPAAEACALLEKAMPEGITPVRCRLMGADTKPVGRVIDTAVFTATFPASVGGGELADAVERFCEMSTLPYERVQPRRTRTVDIRGGVHDLQALSAGAEGRVALKMTVDDGIAGTIKPWEVVEVVAGLAGISREVWQEAEVNRAGLFARRGDRLVSPMDTGARRSGAAGGPRGVRY
jgi:radical SAM-linked protein